LDEHDVAMDRWWSKADKVVRLLHYGLLVVRSRTEIKPTKFDVGELFGHVQYPEKSSAAGFRGQHITLEDVKRLKG
jgi:hypothetical protein